MTVGLHLENVCASYPIIDRQTKEHRSVPRFALAYDLRRKESRTQSLKNIWVSLKEGDCLAVIGTNGSGKSTLLRVMSGILPYDSGRIHRTGTAHALLSPAAGFVHQATGYENIYLLGMLLGLTRKEIDSKLDQVIDFADIGDWMFQPVANYSSGMALRLAFAVCTALPAEMLLIDEWIGAGDTRFMVRARQRIQDIVKQTRVLVLASHSESVLRQFCNKAIVMHEGAAVFQGSLQDGLAFYRDLVTLTDYHAQRKVDDPLAQVDPAPQSPITQ
jgi:ABC-type polysaccharide/polyol phosphate transport system ATPase subunit